MKKLFKIDWYQAKRDVEKFPYVPFIIVWLISFCLGALILDLEKVLNIQLSHVYAIVDLTWCACTAFLLVNIIFAIVVYIHFEVQKRKVQKEGKEHENK